MTFGMRLTLLCREDDAMKDDDRTAFDVQQVLDGLLRLYLSSQHEGLAKTSVTNPPVAISFVTLTIKYIERHTTYDL